jgi:3-hydroxyisobutyrate dehydrogenase
MSQLKLGVIGIGAFGARVALRLLWSGYHTLSIYDVADVATRLFTNDYGGMALGSPKMMAQTTDIVITALPSAAELREVCFGWEGVAEGFAKDRGERGIVLDVGTTDPVATAALAKELAARGIDLVSAPAFGTPAEAKEGKLTLVVGGAEAAVARCRPVLDTLATRVLTAGTAEAAQAAGAIADFLRGARLLAAAEAIRLGQRYGFDPAAVVSLGDELGGDVGETVRRDLVTRNFKSGRQLGLIRRNIALAADLAAATDTRSPLLEATLAAWTDAENAIGYGADHSAVIKWLESLPGLASAAAADQNRNLEPVESPPTG